MGVGVGVVNKAVDKEIRIRACSFDFVDYDILYIFFHDILDCMDTFYPIYITHIKYIVRRGYGYI